MKIELVYAIKNGQFITMYRCAGYIQGVFISALSTSHIGAIVQAIENFETWITKI